MRIRENNHPLLCYGLFYDNGITKFVYTSDTSWSNN